MNILILNVGSSSIKYSIYSNKLILKGKFEKLRKRKHFVISIKKLKKIIEKERINIDVIGHRIVHGGRFTQPRALDNGFIKILRKIEVLAPLHDIPEIDVVEACRIFNIKQYAVFDTEFHTTIPEKAQIYGLPYSYYKKGIKHYGFHGIAHRYVIEYLRKNKLMKNKLIICHIGNGVTISAVKNGKSVDTSMGFTPLEGVIMGSRSGSIDPSIIFFLSRKLSIPKIKEILNYKSGLLGISGKSNDIRDLISSKSNRAKLAIEVLCYQISKYISSYIPVLNGLDLLVFTGGIGENVPLIRRKILNYLKFIKFKALVVKVNEEEVIWKEIKKLIS